MLLNKKRTAPFSCLAFPNRSTTFLSECIKPNEVRIKKTK